MRNWQAKIHAFIATPMAIISIIIFVLLVLGAGVLWIREISYDHPGPAIAAAMLAVVALIVGLVGSVNNDLYARNRELLQKIDTLQAHLSHLPQGGLDPPPRLMGLELLVERWQQFEPQQTDSEILYEQFSIAQSIAQLNYSEVDKFCLVKYFPGFKINSGAFHIQPGLKMPFVLKFDSVTNIETEIERYKCCVAGRLGRTPGEPILPQQRYGKIRGKEWGAITYNLLDAHQPEHERLQTLGEYYLSHDPPQDIIEALTKVFDVLRPWWQNPAGFEECGRWRRRSLYNEYERLTRKQRPIQQEVAKVGEKLKLKSLHLIDFNQKQIELDNDLKLRNPLSWVDEIFEAQKLPNWINQPGLRRDSIVHGDLHTGNILVSADDHNGIKAWVIDFPHSHVGPTIQDTARLEADLKFGMLEDDILQPLGSNGLYDFETYLLSKPKRVAQPSFADLIPTQLPENLQNPPLQKIWAAVQCLRDEAQRYMIGNDARPYYLALLHATMPTLYYRNRTPWQKLYTFISAALLCEYLGG
jgi:hypothetical protein